MSTFNYVWFAGFDKIIEKSIDRIYKYHKKLYIDIRIFRPIIISLIKKSRQFLYLYKISYLTATCAKICLGTRTFVRRNKTQVTFVLSNLLIIPFCRFQQFVSQKP